MNKYLNTYCIFAIIVELIPLSDEMSKVYFKNLDGQLNFAESKKYLLSNINKYSFVNLVVGRMKDGKQVIQKVELYDKPLKLSLCKNCAQAFYELENHVIRRVDKRQKFKEPCAICGCSRTGYEYLVFEKIGGNSNGIE